MTLTIDLIKTKCIVIEVKDGVLEYYSGYGDSTVGPSTTPYLADAKMFYLYSLDDFYRLPFEEALVQCRKFYPGKAWLLYVDADYQNRFLIE